MCRLVSARNNEGSACDQALTQQIVDEIPRPYHFTNVWPVSGLTNITI